MEEILSSIRRIIADEQDDDAASASPKNRLAAQGSRDAPPEDEDVLDLTQVAEDEPRPPAGPSMADEDDEAAFRLDENEPYPDEAPAPLHPEPQPEPLPRKVETPVSMNPQHQPDSELLSGETMDRSTSAFARLAKAASGEDQRVVANGGKTVEEFVVEMLRPMLKDWLDQNLETIVEKVVEQEVKKLARRAELL